MTVLTAYCPSYLPWRGLFHRISQADIFGLTDTDRLSPKSEHVRNTIIGPNGPITLTVPVLGGRDQRLCDVRIDNSKDWQKKHWRSIEHAYHDAPFWGDYHGAIQETVCAQYDRLYAVGAATIATLGAFFNVPWQFYLASTLDVHGAGSDFILNLCKHFDADTYLCGKVGRDYLNLEDFGKAGIEVRVQEWTGPRVSALHDLFTEGPVL